MINTNNDADHLDFSALSDEDKKLKSKDIQEAEAFLQWVEDANKASAQTASAEPNVRQIDHPATVNDLSHVSEIDLRWMLRDIRARRFRLMKQSPEELLQLVDHGLVEMRDGLPELTDAGKARIDGR